MPNLDFGHMRLCRVALQLHRVASAVPQGATTPRGAPASPAAAAPAAAPEDAFARRAELTRKAMEACRDPRNPSTRWDEKTQVVHFTAFLRDLKLVVSFVMGSHGCLCNSRNTFIVYKRLGSLLVTEVHL